MGTQDWREVPVSREAVRLIGIAFPVWLTGNLSWTLKVKKKKKNVKFHPRISYYGEGKVGIFHRIYIIQTYIL